MKVHGLSGGQLTVDDVMRGPERLSPKVLETKEAAAMTSKDHAAVVRALSKKRKRGKR